ncbi:hypothetical protein PoB_002801300 [Plakobranchus ocellatus]|uniref:Uncharacterized protein n=1 Tax=Plakobranchus ocellatus TaxID=259542 RepID=A0AAV4A2V6_9GAST|nr:hypothetical protein PoB_002801300 [Plakobranchus ocellatus]
MTQRKLALTTLRLHARDRLTTQRDGSSPTTHIQATPGPESLRSTCDVGLRAHKRILQHSKVHAPLVSGDENLHFREKKVVMVH